MFNRQMMSTSVGSVESFSIDVDVDNWNLITEVFGGVAPISAVDVIITNNAVITSTDPANPAMDLTGLPAGSTITLINLGSILGRGGTGGRGESGFGDGGF